MSYRLLKGPIPGHARATASAPQSKIITLRRSLTIHAGRLLRNGLSARHKLLLAAGGSLVGGAGTYSIIHEYRNLGSKSEKLRLDSRQGFASERSSISDGAIKSSEKAGRDDDKSKRDSKPQEASILPDWSAIGDRIAFAIVPDWARTLPALIAKFQKEMELAPNTLAKEVWDEAHDEEIHPEISKAATVRISDNLCDEELQFLEKRKHFTRQALARYLDITESDVHPDDVPTIAMCGSGGGLRALVAGASSYNSAQKSGLFDCVTYTAGVSGSCWLQTLYFSSLTGQSIDKLLQHLKDRLDVHITFPPPLMRLITSSPTAKYLMAGVLQKYFGVKDADFGLVDVYGLLLAARLMVPHNELDVNPADLKLSSQRQYVDRGAHPLPIYTAVRHEIPLEVVENEPSKGTDKAGQSFSVKDSTNDDLVQQAKQEAWFQWFEFTPYEMFCEELGCGIPTWAVGRQFKEGKSIVREHGFALPELGIPLLMGVWGSAFCATLAHYYKEISPLVKGLSGFNSLDAMINEKNDDLVKVHPIDPSKIPNFALAMKGALPESCPQSLNTNEDIELMDAGMSNNLPIYPLLRPGRNVDMIIAFDASADIQKENWLRVVDGYARQRGITSWPVGTGWPEKTEVSARDTAKAIDEADNASVARADDRVRQAHKDQKRMEEKDPDSSAVGQGTIWVGSTKERVSTEEPPKSKRVKEDWQLMTPDAGIAVVYFPLLPNPRVEGVDPDKSEFMSTWNFIYTPEDVDKVVQLASENFKDGEDKTKMAVRAVYERKKRLRLEREQQQKSSRASIWSAVRDLRGSS